MEFKYVQITLLPKEGSCIVNSEQGLQLQSMLNKRWMFEIDDPRYKSWDPTEMPDGHMFDSHNRVNDEKVYILIWNNTDYYGWSTAIATAEMSHSKLIKFTDYFEEDEKYNGYFIGKSYNI
jgi:hypothetical protein